MKINFKGMKCNTMELTKGLIVKSVFHSLIWSKMRWNKNGME